MPFLERVPYAKLKVEIAYDSGFSTAEGDRTWTAVTDDVDAVIGMQITYGRSDELTQPSPNTLSVTIDNDGGDYTPTSGGPLSIKKGLPIRVTVTYGGVDYPRYLGYIDSCSVLWPNGGEEMSQVAVTAASRRARLGQTAPLTSAIRAAYLATGPQAYWPMTDIIFNTERYVFRDVTNSANLSGSAAGSIGAFAPSGVIALNPIVDDGSAGPTDETSLVKIPAFTDAGLLGTFAHYVGGGGVVSVGTTGELTFEVLARVLPTGAGDVGVTVGAIYSSDLLDQLSMNVATSGSSNSVYGSYVEFDSNRSFVGNGNTITPNPAEYTAATDGTLHHWAITLSGGNHVKFYFDGVLMDTLTTPAAFTQRFTTISLGHNTLYANLWVGHAAVTDRALSAAEVLAHAQAATAVSETDAERVVRVAGRIGVPADEIDVETSVALPLGPQSEDGRSAAEVLDELATSTGGVLYDTRDGHLALQARNHRYNLASAFTLSAAAQQIEPDLTVVDDHRYTKNIIVYSRTGSSDAASTLTDEDSRAAYGDFNPGAYTVVSESDDEVEAFAQNLLTRYADPPPRVSQVTVVVTDLDEEQRSAVMSADIGTRLALAGLPAQVPTDPAYVFFEGATETISMTTHALTMNTTPADLFQNVATTAAPALTNSGVTTAY